MCLNKMQILPAYAEDLVVEDSSVRIKAVKLLGAVFSVGYDAVTIL